MIMIKKQARSSLLLVKIMQDVKVHNHLFTISNVSTGHTRFKILPRDDTCQDTDHMLYAPVKVDCNRTDAGRQSGALLAIVSLATDGPLCSGGAAGPPLTVGPWTACKELGGI